MGGRTQAESQMGAFRNVLAYCELEDLEFLGAPLPGVTTAKGIKEFWKGLIGL